MALRTFPTFAAASEAMSPGFTVGGTFREKTDVPVYFLLSADASDEDAHSAGFEARYGKPMDWYQRSIRTMAQALPS